MRAVMLAVVALSPKPRGFQAEQVAALVSGILRTDYTRRQASYDLKKLRAKGLVERVHNSRHYTCPPESLRILSAVTVLREHVFKPLLAGLTTHRHAPARENPDSIDEHYAGIREEMEKLFHAVGLAA
jgi:DNA-binding transcriptional ArsR family regulator